MFLSASNILKPCCFLNTTRQYNFFKEWGEARGLTVEADLDASKHTMETILSSPTWLALIESFKHQGQSPSTCEKQCGPGSYKSTSGTAKHSTFKE